MGELKRASPAKVERPLLVFVHGSAELYGSDKVLLNLVTALSDEADFQPLVLLHEDGPLMAALQSAGVETHVGGVAKIERSMLRLQAPWVLWRALQQSLVDLDRVVSLRPVSAVYSNTLAVLGGAYWAWRRGFKHLWHVHEIIRRPALVRRGLPWLANHFSDRVVSNSLQTERWLLQQSPGLRSRSTVIFNGLPPVPPAREADRQASRARLGLEPADILVSLVGRLNHWKGQDLLVQALGRLQVQGRLGALQAAIVGDVFAGHEGVRAALVAQVNAAGLNQKVHFVPFQADIYPIWWASDIAVVPSLEPEPFGLVAIEAMACGVPVVAAAHGGLLDIVEHEVTGLLFRPRDADALAQALLRLADDTALRQSLGAAGKMRQSAQFSLQSQVQQTRELCLELVAA